MTGATTKSGPKMGLWYMNLGLLVAMASSAYCVYAVFNVWAPFATWPWILKGPVGLLLGAATFVGASVATVWLASAFSARRRAPPRQ